MLFPLLFLRVGFAGYGDDGRRMAVREVQPDAREVQPKVRDVDDHAVPSFRLRASSECLDCYLGFFFSSFGRLCRVFVSARCCAYAQPSFVVMPLHLEAWTLNGTG